MSIFRKNTKSSNEEVIGKPERNDDKKITIKVLGSGCKRCHSLLDNVNGAVDKGHLNANVEYITDLQLIARYGIMSMPALVINEKVASTGKVLKADEIISLVGKTV